MSIMLIDKHDACRVVCDGRLTFQFARELEDRVIDALRRYSRFELDLSGITEIDLHGLHLLQLLTTVGGDKVKTVAGSPIVDQARKRLLASSRGTWLRGTPEERARAA